MSKISMVGKIWLEVYRLLIYPSILIQTIRTLLQARVMRSAREVSRRLGEF